MNDYLSGWKNNIATWEEHAAHLRGTPCRILEIGSLEGQSAAWMLENLCSHPDAHLTCVDPWDGPFQARGVTLSGAEAAFDRNTARWADKLTKVKGFSFAALPKLPGSFDLVYIDGDHEGRSAVEDFALAWRKVIVGGRIVFDDIGSYMKGLRVQASFAVEMVMLLWGDLFELVHRRRQAWFKRVM